MALMKRYATSDAMITTDIMIIPSRTFALRDRISKCLPRDVFSIPNLGGITYQIIFSSQGKRKAAQK
jgi:hypothetical protein